MISLRTTLLAAGLFFVLAGTAACGGDSDDEALTPTASVGVATVTATVTSEGGAPTATSTEAAPDETATPSTGDGLEAPSDVTLSGALPDLNTPVPPGQGEQGRLTIEWTDNSDSEDGFRLYQECGGAQSVLLEVAADETSYGPFQTCRPGRVGVAAYNESGESEIAWAS